jgi:hypothetical protein
MLIQSFEEDLDGKAQNDSEAEEEKGIGIDVNP